MDGCTSHAPSMWDVEYIIQYIVSNTPPYARDCKFGNTIFAEREIQAYGRPYLEAKFVHTGNTGDDTSQEPELITIPVLTFVHSFGAYRNNYRALLGIYTSPANLPTAFREQVCNQFPLTLGPFSTSLPSIIASIKDGLAAFEKGKLIKLPDRRHIFLCVMLLGFTGDLHGEAANDGVKGPTSNTPCRICLIGRDELDNIHFDIVTEARWTQYMEDKIATTLPLAPAVRLAQRNLLGLVGPSPWLAAHPAYDPYQHNPSEACHSEKKEMGERMLEYLFDNILTAQGNDLFLKGFRDVQMPHTWGNLQNPVYHWRSYTYTDVASIIVLIPLILRRFVNSDSFIKVPPLTRIGQEFSKELEGFKTSHQIITWIYYQFANSLFVVFDKNPHIPTTEAAVRITRVLYKRLTWCAVGPDATAVRKRTCISNFHATHCNYSKYNQRCRRVKTSAI